MHFFLAHRIRILDTQPYAPGLMGEWQSEMEDILFESSDFDVAKNSNGEYVFSISRGFYLYVIRRLSSSDAFRLHKLFSSDI